MPPLLTPVTTREMPTPLTTVATLLYSPPSPWLHRWRVRSSRRPSSTAWPPRSRARRCDDSSSSSNSSSSSSSKVVVAVAMISRKEV
eukprot:scaffold107118_cov69-Phaeocystis_antarctica.AAC.1